MSNYEQVRRALRASCRRKLVTAFHQAMLTSVGAKKPTTKTGIAPMLRPLILSMQKCGSYYFLGASTSKQICKQESTSTSKKERKKKKKKESTSKSAS